ncbi:hypothetical protein JYT97_03320 [Haliea sp. AH-315-K21]|uniref:Uncharacterized protein n=1 Tax=SAR86 cluster bacterium TaxID=2030880 RepID=A0A2A5CIQ9_9GAMM|nr:hypothetical protein [Haliea sp. AH-315-K21]MBN4075244.1 hypothetical protein [Gammaproteobacteria bacterium AH-315-E17]PCJ43759.1 MAG: hypothetical protein COA71_02510 [SAR86 cluster bacterium]
MSSIVRKFSIGIALFAMTSSLGLAQDRQIAGTNCTNPVVPSIPGDAGQDVETLLDAQDAVQAFMADSNAFIDCLENVMDRRSRRGLNQETSDLWTASINGNIDAQETIAAAFNEQVQIYQASED